MTAEGVDAHRNIFTIALFGSIFLLITAFVFLSAAIMFLIRTVTLMILMMISPIAFIGMVLPNTSGYAKQWWSELLHQSMFAPIYMMFIYITATAINTPGFKAVLANTGNGNNFASLFTGGGAVTVVFNFILIIGLLLGALISAKSLGAKGANFATEKAGAGLGKLAFGTSAWLGRRTLGAGASRIADWGAKQDMATTGMGKFALKQLRNVGDNSFDARNNKTFRETAGNLPGGGIKLGEGRKGGYTTIAKEVQKEQTKYGQSLGKNTKDIKLSEVYGEKIKDHSIISSILGETAGNIKASKSLLDLPKHEKSLTEAKTKLKEMEKKDSSSTPEEVVKQENTIEELKEKIQKIKDSIKDK
ncbi:hypothetical protein KJ603_02325 [Patescibacteria group bacterium]|nr:hypothetical protein [Patescibacteria group bacterium]